MEILDNINMLSQCLFGGFQITVLFLFILKLIFKHKAALWSDLFLHSNCILLFTALLYGTIFLVDLYRSRYSQVTFQQEAFKWRVLGPYWYSYWIMVLIPLFVPHIFWFKKFRKSYKASLVIASILTTGNLFNRLLIILTSLYRDYLPSSWTYYGPDPVEIIFAGSLFTFILMLVYFVSKKRSKLLSKNF